MSGFAATVKGIRKIEVAGGPAQVELTVHVPWEFGTHVHLGDFLPIEQEVPRLTRERWFISPTKP